MATIRLSVALAPTRLFPADATASTFVFLPFPSSLAIRSRRMITASRRPSDMVEPRKMFSVLAATPYLTTSSSMRWGPSTALAGTLEPTPNPDAALCEVVSLAMFLNSPFLLQVDADM